MEERREIPDLRISVGTFLSEALEYHAEQQLADELDDDIEYLVRSLAKEFLDGKTQLFTERSSEAEFLLERKKRLLSIPWLRYAIDLDLANRVLWRIHIAGKRYLELDYGSLSQPLSDKAARYVAEVVAAYAFGFEAASMALCRACLEQILKDTLVVRKIWTRPYLERNRFSAMDCLQEARKNQLLSDQGVAAGKHIVDKSDQVMHKFMDEERIQKQLALDSIKHLITVVLELEASADKTG